jgi:hypothetical protein
MSETHGQVGAIPDRRRCAGAKILVYPVNWQRGEVIGRQLNRAYVITQKSVERIRTFKSPRRSAISSARLAFTNASKDSSSVERPSGRVCEKAAVSPMFDSKETATRSRESLSSGVPVS